MTQQVFSRKPQPIGTSLLGAPTTYPSGYAPHLLRPIPRALGRAALALSRPLPFYGIDAWGAYELAWCDDAGRPQVGSGVLQLPCDSPCLIESKSLKLYLFSLNDCRFAAREDYAARVRADLSAICGAPVQLTWDVAEAAFSSLAEATCIDDAPWRPPTRALDTSGLTARRSPGHRLWVSHLLRSLCPVTAQPDWASVVLSYSGCELDAAGLLTYIASFRQHQGFHEQCTEQIYMDVWRACAPTQLTVYARYTRRGGLDINPLRSSHLFLEPMGRLWRQ